MHPSVESPPHPMPDGSRARRRIPVRRVAAAENERIVIPRYGPPEMLSLVREPVPPPRPGEVRIKVQAAGVSFGDVAQRSNVFVAGAPPMPYTPGYDVVGTVDANGDGVTNATVDDRVTPLTMFGGYARYVCAPSAWLVKVPPHVDASQAVAVVLNYTTAWQMLRRVARLRSGDAILVYGGAGGDGTALLYLAGHLQLVVAAAAAMRWHQALSGQAALLFDERDPSSRNAVQQFRPSGFDAAFDGIGGSHVWKTRARVARQGKVVAFGVSGDVRTG